MADDAQTRDVLERLDESYHHLAWKQIRDPHHEAELCFLTALLSATLTESVSHSVIINVRLICLNC